MAVLSLPTLYTMNSNSVTITIGFVVISIAAYILQRNPLRAFHLIGSEHGNYAKRLVAYVGQAEALYRHGYQTFNGTAFRITTIDGEHLVVSRQHVDELKARPESEVSNAKVLDAQVESQYTGLPSESPLIARLVRTDLTRNLQKINPLLVEQVQLAVKTEIPPCIDWTPIVINNAVLRIVAMASGSIFLGPELCRKEEYLHASINYTVDVFTAVAALKKWPQILRPIGQFFVPELNRIQDHKDRATRFLRPIIRERKRMMDNEEDLPDDLLQWMLNMAEQDGIRDEAYLSFQQLMLSMAAVHTTSTTAIHILYDIAAYPHVIDALREEIKAVLLESDGVFTPQSLFQMKLLDSVMRESQRMNPISMTRFVRQVEKHITLKDGTSIPAGTVVESPMAAIFGDEKIYPNPEKFDPHRFVHLRDGTTPDPIGYRSKEQYQFVASTKENLSFGYGRNACPGRFFATHVIKLMLATILLNYDIKLPDEQKTRYENLKISAIIIPDPTKEIMLKRI